MALRSRWDDRGSEGFSMVEVVVSLLVMAIILGSLAYAIGVRVSTIASSRNEQTGQGLLTRALNEVRALPYTTVILGLTTTNTTTPTFIKKAPVKATTPTHPTTTTLWTFHYPGIKGTGETIPHTKYPSKPPHPYYPQRTTSNTVNGVGYTVTTVPTKLKTPNPSRATGPTTPVKPITTTSGVVRVTVIISWSSLGHGLPTKLVGQTVVYSPSAASNATYTTKKNPYAAPYEPNFTASASAGAGHITIRPYPTSPTTPLSGVERSSFTSLGLSLAGSYSNSAFVQTASVLDWTKSTGASLLGSTDKSVGAFVSTAATSDPSSAFGTYQHKTMAASTLAPVTVTGTDHFGKINSVTVTPSRGDTGNAVSTASAASTQNCSSITGTVLSTTMPCGSSTAEQHGTVEITANFYAKTVQIGQTVTLASVKKATSTPDQTFSARYPAGHGSCPNTGLTYGCVTAGARMYLGKVTLGGLPVSPVAFEPPGWSSTTGLISLTNYSSTVSSWAKSGDNGGKTSHVATSDAMPAPGGSTPVLHYYNGSGYASVTLSLSTTGTINPSVTWTKKITGVTATIAITSTLKVNQTTGRASFSTSTYCAATCGVTETVGSPLTGHMTYTVKVGSTVVANLWITVNLGSVSTRSTYQEPT